MIKIIKGVGVKNFLIFFFFEIVGVKKLRRVSEAWVRVVFRKSMFMQIRVTYTDIIE